MSRRRRSSSSSSSMAAAAMPLDELEPWLQARAAQHPIATSLPMLDGYVAAIVAGPVSISPPDSICPLLAIDADAFNHDGTREFAAISAVALRHNDISSILSTEPHRFAPTHARKPNGDADARPWYRGFHAAMRLRLPAWTPLLDIRNINHGLLLPILLHCVDDEGRPLLGPPKKGRETEEFLRNAHTDIPDVVEAMPSTGCRRATLARADHGRCGSSYRLRSNGPRADGASRKMLLCFHRFCQVALAHQALLLGVQTRRGLGHTVLRGRAAQLLSFGRRKLLFDHSGRHSATRSIVRQLTCESLLNASHTRRRSISSTRGPTLEECGPYRPLRFSAATIPSTIPPTFEGAAMRESQSILARNEAIAAKRSRRGARMRDRVSRSEHAEFAKCAKPPSSPRDDTSASARLSSM
ncbi:UPF0149 family protein [Bradyrhizobium brasilense]|uniref:UPF0149 family protein n=1 Tax=Bradyrhizobium brasilense TaxID=1419277 RepID=UPI0024B1A832|nr:UPF0149 family protein [Bradyrhizobium australafricanum]WFU31389.1 UPF0149 family protein [Bradyrhizobium australafricanum]